MGRGSKSTDQMHSISSCVNLCRGDGEKVGEEQDTADVSSRAVVHINVKVKARATRVLANEALVISLLHRPLKRQPLVHILSPAYYQVILFICDTLLLKVGVREHLRLHICKARHVDDVQK